MFARRHNAVLLALLFFSLAVAVPLYAAPLPQLDFPLSGIVNSNANLRAGPGTNFAVVGGARAGETVDVIGCNAACDWYELPNARWVAAFLVDLQARPPGDPAQVASVVDGDTIEVLLDGVTYRLRYIGMDAPELSEDWGDQAAAANAALVDGQTVYLETDVSDTDPFGRLLRHVWLADGTLVGEDLVRQGYAYAASYPPDVKYQERIGLAQEAALEAERGFWGEAVTPIPTPTVPTRSQSLPTVNTTANLRAGPGTNYAVIGGATIGQRLDLTGRNAAGDWVALSDGAWIAARLVDNVPEGLVVIDPPPGTPTPPPPPTATPVPVRSSNCDPSYPTVCIPPSPPDLDCGEIPYRRFQVRSPDPHRFDGDHDGIGCER